MADFTRRAGSGGESLDAIARTDQLLDAIAAEHRLPPTDAGDAALFALLADWRDEVRWPPASDLITEREAAAALRDGVNSMPAKRGGHRGLTIVASLAAAVLCIGGFGAVVSGAGPGDPLYGLRTTMLGEPQQVRDDRVALAAKQEMEQVQTLIQNGDWEQAQQKLASVSDSVKTVDDTGTKQQLIDQWNQLAVKVDQQDPAATVPPSAAPGPLEQLTLPETLPPLPETVPPLPSGLPPLPSGLPSLPETVPPLPDLSLPESVPSFTLPSSIPPLPQSLFPSPPGSPSSGPAPGQPASAPPPVTTTTTAPAATSAAPTSEASSTVASTPTSAPPASATQSQAVTTTAAPSSAPSPSPSSITTTTTTTTTTTPTAAAAAPRVAESQTVPAAPTIAQSAPQRAPDVVTTTMPRPILQLPLLGGN